MAKIAKLPSLAIINGFKGTIDFYVHDGQPCARSWPRSPGHKRSPAVQAGWSAFTWASQNWQALSEEVRHAYRDMASGTNMTGRDIFVKSYISSAFIRLL